MKYKDRLADAVTTVTQWLDETGHDDAALRVRAAHAKHAEGKIVCSQCRGSFHEGGGCPRCDRGYVRGAP